jgi:hypothetical protein
MQLLSAGKATVGQLKKKINRQLFVSVAKK